MDLKQKVKQTIYLANVNGNLKEQKDITIVSKILSSILENDQKWTSKSPLISSQKLTVYVIDKYKDLFKIKTRELCWF